MSVGFKEMKFGNINEYHKIQNKVRLSEAPNYYSRVGLLISKNEKLVFLKRRIKDKRDLKYEKCTLWSYFSLIPNYYDAKTVIDMMHW